MTEPRYGGLALNQVRAEYGLEPLPPPAVDQREIVLAWQCGECEWSASVDQIRLRLSRQALARLVKHLQNRLEEENHARSSPTPRW